MGGLLGAAAGIIAVVGIAAGVVVVDFSVDIVADLSSIFFFVVVVFGIAVGIPVVEIVVGIIADALPSVRYSPSLVLPLSASSSVLPVLLSVSPSIVPWVLLSLLISVLSSGFSFVPSLIFSLTIWPIFPSVL